jgi:hypothetical protein
VKKFTVASFVLLMACGIASAQSGLEEIVVTGARRTEVKIPATSLKRQADYLLLQVEVNNDSRDYKTRRDEIYATLRAMQAAAERDKAIELSLIRDESIVLPLTLDDTTLNFEDTGIGGRLSTTINIKTPISSGSADGAALIAKLKNFVSDIKSTGRTTLYDEDETQVSVVNIGQYRDPVIQLFANDVKKITNALGGDYRVVISGLDQPIQWVRSGTLDVTIFVPYTYDVVPTSISSYTPKADTSDDD